MRHVIVTIAVLPTLAATLAASPQARAEMGTADAVPAATLLLPYFEVDLSSPLGTTTILSINNASSAAALAQVTLWTDWGNPSLGFQIYLTGYDVQSINLRDVFNGFLPITADAGEDPGDDISPQGPLSTDLNFPGGVGPCGNPYGGPDPTLPTKILNLQRVHTGQSSPIDGLCWGASYGDQVARGYVTIDSVNQCSLLTPADVGYDAVLTNQNVLWGDYAVVDPSNNFGYGETLVHIEACTPSVGNGAGYCPLAPGDYSFYARYLAGTAADQREPLATLFAARYAIGPDQQTDLLVWRDTKTLPAGGAGHVFCGAVPSWFPLSQTDVVAFSGSEDAADLCFLPDNVSPPIGGTQTCFPLATQRVSVDGGNAIAADTLPPFVSGWLFLNLNHTVASDLFPGVAQSFVASIRSSSGRFSTGSNAVHLDNALDPASSTILIP